MWGPDTKTSFCTIDRADRNIAFLQHITELLITPSRRTVDDDEHNTAASARSFAHPRVSDARRVPLAVLDALDVGSPQFAIDVCRV